MPTEEQKPIESSTPTESTKTLDLDSTKPEPPKTITFKKTKFFIFLSLGILLALAAIIGSYFLGQNSVKNDVVAKKDEAVAKKEEIPDVVEVNLGEEGTAKNGIAIKLEEAKIDQVYESQKEESKKVIQRTSTNSAYLDSEYYKTSNLLLKVSLRNTKDKALSYSQADFRLKDSEDNQYTTSGAYEGQSTPTLYTINPGETTKLNQAYIVPTSEKSFKLIYQNVVVDFSL
ncbi:MAG TPA: DUF4352 domain-containing protein [Candidatus Saccharimonadales bacterium]|nr:DUF4352 domain-containing protein [Candidatus Saccharimonadales bacterium]